MLFPCLVFVNLEQIERLQNDGHSQSSYKVRVGVSIENEKMEKIKPDLLVRGLKSSIGQLLFFIKMF